jgi:hypothetical protein
MIGPLGNAQSKGNQKNIGRKLRIIRLLLSSAVAPLGIIGKMRAMAQPKTGADKIMRMQ